MDGGEHGSRRSGCCGLHDSNETAEWLDRAVAAVAETWRASRGLLKDASACEFASFLIRLLAFSAAPGGHVSGARGKQTAGESEHIQGRGGGVSEGGRGRGRGTRQGFVTLCCGVLGVARCEVGRGQGRENAKIESAMVAVLLLLLLLLLAFCSSCYSSSSYTTTVATDATNTYTNSTSNSTTITATTAAAAVAQPVRAHGVVVDGISPSPPARRYSR